MAANENGTKFDNYKVRDLRKFLRDRGQRISGGKQELVQRAVGVVGLQIERTEDVKSGDTKAAQERLQQKFVSPLGEKLPHPQSLVAGWNTNLDAVPSFTENDLYNYLVLSKGRTFDSNALKAKRQLKARVFYEDRHVYDVKHHIIEKDCSHCFIKCKVIPSIPTVKVQKNPDYQVWVCLSKVSGRVHAADCTCSAGEGESCNHVAALLYALCDITQQNKEGPVASTSKPCKWNKPRARKLSPKMSQELTFKKFKFSSTTSACSTKTKSLKQSNSDTGTQKPDIKPVNINRFSSALKKCNPHAAWLLTVQQEDDQQAEELVTHLPEITFSFSDHMDLKSPACVEIFNNYFQSIRIDKPKIEEVEVKTRGQASNKLWQNARCGLLTSSNFGVIAKKRESTSASIVKVVLGYYNSFTSESVRWGTSHESAARRVYFREMRKTHPTLELSLCGLCINEEWPFLGSSPDGLVWCSHCEDKLGLLEIKCPYKFRNISPEQASLDKSFFCEMKDHKVTLKRQHNYYYQIQGQMAILQRSYCDFFIWTLKGFSIERILFDKEFWELCLEKLQKFYIEDIIPEMFTSRIKRTVGNSQSQGQKEE